MEGEQRIGLLLFHPTNVFGGAERTLLNLLSHLSRDRFRVVLVGHPGVFPHPDVDVFFSLSETGLADGFMGLRRSFADARTLCALARQQRCTVMLGMLHYGAIAAMLCRVFSGGRLHVIASPRTPSQLGVRYHVGERGRQAWLWRFLVGAVCRFSERVLVASEGMKRECVDAFGASPARVRVVANSVDDEVLALARLTLPAIRESASADRPWQIVTAGRLAAEKDLPTLLRALALLRQQGVALRLEIIGAGPELSALQALAETLGITPQVVFIGFTAQPLVHIREADLFVHTALFEGFGNVLLEAMACGVPLVATDCDFGPREIVQDAINGRLVPPSDPVRLAETVAALLGDAKARRQMATAALTRVEDFSAAKMARAYEAVFEECAAACQPVRTFAVEEVSTGVGATQHGVTVKLQAGAEQEEPGPLVSVLIRSMGRPELQEALASVACQHWRSIEVKVVDASGEQRVALPQSFAYPLQLLGGQTPLNRSEAANCLLDAATGTFVLFLDDDDWLLEEHLHKLVNALISHPQAVAAYADVSCVRRRGDDRVEEVHRFANEFDVLRLAYENFMPIHAVLFRRELVQQGCRFATTLKVYEDWAFWLQLVRFGDFVHCPGVSAVYRLDSGDGFGCPNSGEEIMHDDLLQFVRAVRHCWSDEQLVAMLKLFGYKRQYEQLRQQHEQQQAELAQQLQDSERREIETGLTVPRPRSWSLRAWLKRLSVLRR